MIPEDWQQVKAIYESGIATGVATFEKSSPNWENWDKSHLPFGRFVMTFNNEIVGWTALSPVSNRCIYGGVAEVSVYVSDKYRGRGIGKKLLNDLITDSEKNGIWTLQAGIFTENIASVKLHQSVGFRLIGFREKIGKLDGKWKDNLIFEKRSKIVGQD
ncbi:GNAT family N-acetyltransferase [Carboxylicivirga caseinilyticus]|uniref:GNAT family N-acetyltransferase n=1 Tax=Carboxylicivirga caseinilyticus TaxID=3417572 RepID=UPI003D329189